MNRLEELQNKTRDERTPLESCIVYAAIFEEAEHDGETELMEVACEQLVAMTSELAEFRKNASVTACAYCGHESPRSDPMAVIDHIMTCDKRPEKKLLERAFQIEDGLLTRLEHVVKDGYHLEDCEMCGEIREILETWHSVDELKADQKEDHNV